MFLLTFTWFSLHASSQVTAGDRYWYLIPPPPSPGQWDSFRTGLRSWKDSLLSAIHYDDRYYKNDRFKWASGAYAVCFVMAGDRALYDSNFHYDIKKFLARYESDYGGVDIVLLWAAYPQLGFDGRDQYSFYRRLPGGTAALKKLSEQLHAIGKRLFIAWNPWDHLARENGKIDEEELINLVRDTGADGIFLDTISGIAGFRSRIDKVCPGVVLQSEMQPDAAQLGDVHQSWLETPIWDEHRRNTELDEVPFILRNRWLEQRHLVFHLSRWSHEQSAVIQNAFMNGCGIVIWEDVFGTMNELNPHDRSLLRSMLPLMRRYTDFFTRGQWTPLVPTGLYRTFVSRWQLDDKTLWTIVNRQGQPVIGPLLQTPHRAGIKYFDLIAGKEAPATITGDKATININLGPHGLGCILAINEQELDTALATFLTDQARSNSLASPHMSYQLPPHILQPVISTPRYRANAIPPGMRNIPVPADTIDMEIHFRQRECGFYPAAGVIDISYTMALDQPGVARQKLLLHPFAMDETPVTNAQYAQFLRATGYQPKYADAFLAHWTDGRPSKEEADHPVVWVTLEDARAYANWAGKRLPTEYEWQWAAQGGGAGRQYPWGDHYDSSLCNHGQTGGTTAVRRFPFGRTAQGLYDMCGNVWQLTESQRSDGHNEYCILRGGSWYRSPGSGWYADQGPQPANFAAKYLLTWPGLDRCATIGFRCVVDLDR